ncbi:YkyA family protein [Bacillus sp. JJ634]
MNKHLSILAIVLCSTIVLSGCWASVSPEEKVYRILEDSVKKEHEFEEQHERITQLEKEEKKIYQDIIELGWRQSDSVRTLAEEALDNIEEREKFLAGEHKKIQASQKTSMKMENQIDKIEREEIKKQVITLHKTMNKRYETYEKLYEAYRQSLVYDRELYEMFTNETLKMDQLQEQIEKINKSYEKVLRYSEQFNELTETFMQQKADFYRKNELGNDRE